MSLLEDVFLEDEAGEAQDLERIIEGDGYEHQEPNSEDDDDGERRDDEAEEDKRRVDPNSTKTKKVVRNPRFVLNPARLTGPRGIHVIPEHFKNFKFKGKGHEKEDLDLVLKKLEHWAYRLYPKFKFEDCLKKMEILGKKRTVMVNLIKIRSDQYSEEEAIVQKDSSDDEGPAVEAAAPEDEDEFDKMLQQQITLAHTPAGKKLQVAAGDIGTPMAMPKATSSPSISDEQKQRMLQNRAMAEQRRLAKLKQVHEATKMGGQVERESVDLTTNETKDDTNEDSQVSRSIDDVNNVVEIDHPNNIPQGSIDVTLMNNYNSKSGLDESRSVVDLTEKTDFAVTRKRRHKINDSDDESGNSDGETITVGDDIDLPVSKRADIDKGVAKKTVLNEDSMVDLTEAGVKRVKRVRKANIIDSSDEECDVTAEDISITVDVHRENSQQQKHQTSSQEKIASTKELTKETTEDLFQKQQNLDHIATSDVRSEIYERRFEKEKIINAMATGDKYRNDCVINENLTEEQKNEKSSTDKETSNHRSDKQNRIDKDTSINQFDKDSSEIRSEIECDTASNRILTVNKATHIKETTENGNSLNNLTNLAEENLADKNEDQENCENKTDSKISVDVMDVDFSEEF